jgi:hypothetical protein
VHFSPASSSCPKFDASVTQALVRAADRNITCRSNTFTCVVTVSRFIRSASLCSMVLNRYLIVRQPLVLTKRALIFKFRSFGRQSLRRNPTADGVGWEKNPNSVCFLGDMKLLWFAQVNRESDCFSELVSRSKRGTDLIPQSSSYHF